MQRIYSATSQGMARDVCVLPLQTDQHALHSAMWIVPGFAFTELCLACALTRLGDPEGWSLLRKKVLREFAALLASATHPGYAIFKEDLRVQQHLATTALGTGEALVARRPPCAECTAHATRVGCMHVCTNSLSLFVDSFDRCSEEEEEEEVVACSEGESCHLPVKAYIPLILVAMCIAYIHTYIHTYRIMTAALLKLVSHTHTHHTHAHAHTHTFSTPGYCCTSHVQAGQCRCPGEDSQQMCSDLRDYSCKAEEDGTALEADLVCAAAEEGACQRCCSLSG